MIRSTGVVLRAAAPDDAPACGPLLFSTWPSLYLALLGSEAHASRVLASLFGAKGNTFSWDATQVAVRGERIIGVAAAYGADQGQLRATGSLRPALFALGPVSFLRVLFSIWRIADASIGVDPRHFYLANVAVAPEDRGSGTGGILLRDVERRARAGGRGTVSLEVDGTNLAARRFYERAGYIVAEARESRRLAALTGSGTRLLMCKDVSSPTPGNTV